MTRISTVARSGAALVAASIMGCGGASADDEKPSLSQQLANPIANLTSVPIQYNALFGAGRDKKGTISVLDIQPVIPIKLNDDWNLITRTILPVAATNNFLNGLGDARGLGDTQVSLFLSPEKAGPGGLIWGVGTVINIPTATDRVLGTRERGLVRPPSHSCRREIGPLARSPIRCGPSTATTSTAPSSSHG